MSGNANVKKNISVNLAKAIEPLIKQYYRYLRIKSHIAYKLYITTKDDSSDLFFGIDKEWKNGQGKHGIDFESKPFSSINSESAPGSLIFENFINAFKEWLENIKYYETYSILDDPILNDYQKEFYNDFKIVDEDADEVPFSYIQQLKLTEFLETVYAGIDSVKTDKNENIINDLKNDINDLKNAVTVETKNGFMGKLSKFFAKARKGGIKISTYVLSEFIKGFIKEGGKHAFNFAIKNADKLPEYIEQIGQFVTQLKG